jgi:hypothetical protein
VNTEHKEFTFKYQVEGKTAISGYGKWGTAISVFSILIVTIPFLFFSYHVLNGAAELWPFALMFGILSLLFGPYQFWIKNFYFFGLTKDGTLMMRSVINFIPLAYEIKVKDISRIKQENLSKSPAVLFYGKNNNVIGRFNPMTMNFIKFYGYLNLMLEIYPDVELTLKDSDKQ